MGMSNSVGEHFSQSNGNRQPNLLWYGRMPELTKPSQYLLKQSQIGTNLKVNLLYDLQRLIPDLTYSLQEDYPPDFKLFSA